jgi:hypothetical protein
VGGCLGREIRQRAQVRTRRSTVGAGSAELTGHADSAEKEKGTRGATTQRLANRAHEIGERRDARGRSNWHRQVGPTRQRAREGGRARERTAADRRGPPVRRRGRMGARPGWAELGRLGCISFFFFSGFSNSFSISFL